MGMFENNNLRISMNNDIKVNMDNNDEITRDKKEKITVIFKTSKGVNSPLTVDYGTSVVTC